MSHSPFTVFVAIDWSGAKGNKHKGIAIAEARVGTGAPRLVRSGHVWSRIEVLDWLLEQAAVEPTLFGFDFSFAPPFIEREAYLPGEEGVPRDAKASFAGMRLLNRLSGKVAIWPFDPLPHAASTVVEIYTRIYLQRAGMSGKKLRIFNDLNIALRGLDSGPLTDPFDPTDHQTDALVTAAGMRSLAADPALGPAAFSPADLTPAIARTEGWTFGVL